jgi:hypothetical protein
VEATRSFCEGSGGEARLSVVVVVLREAQSSYVPDSDLNSEVMISDAR